MHINDGLLPITVLAGGYAVTTALTWYSLRKINKLPDPQAAVPKVALLTSAFFVASWVHIPVPPTSVHLVLNGLMGVVLGWYAMPAIVVGLLLQAVMFQHGGLTTLGVNAAMIGIPALLGYGIFQLKNYVLKGYKYQPHILAFTGGALGVGITALIAFTILITTIPAYVDVTAERTAITALTVAHVPLALIEGVFTAMIVTFLLRVRPDMVDGYAATA
ncbi:MAG: cobalt transporter CbiM [Chloroflexota bacterium]